MFQADPLSTLVVDDLAAMVGGYLLGSIPFGLIAARLGGAGDIRAIGSGSIGATNVLRTGRKGLALATLIGDAGKGVAAVLLALAFLGGSQAVLAGGAAFVGHLFPIWLRFRGGKGIATAAGVILALAWPVGLAAAATWAVVAALFRISSLASLATAALAPVWLLALAPGRRGLLVLLLAMAALVFVRHGENIRRLARREEPRIGAPGRGRA